VTINKTLCTDIQQIPFQNASGVEWIINTWVAKKTNNKIPELLKPKTILPDSKFVLVNAMFFTGTWLNQFAADSTISAKFTTAKGSVDGKFMKMTQKVKLITLADLNATAIELRYKAADASMLLLLPNKVGDLPKLEKKLNSMDIINAFASQSEEEVKLEIPKFKISYGTDLVKALKTVEFMA